MAQGQLSLKRIGVDKTNSRIVTITAVAAFLVVFFLIGSYMLLGQLLYQNRVIGAKKEAVKQLKVNLESRDSLVDSYKAFVSSPQNVLGGNPEGTGKNDGSNAKIILDALPSKYDFPALTASLEKVLLEKGVKIQNISGVDDEVVQSVPSALAAPQPVEIPFEFTVGGGYTNIQAVIDALEHSIRPIQVLTTEISGDQQNLTLTLTGKTYYQPERTLNIQKKVVK